MSPNGEYLKFLDTHFKRLRIRQPLFYNWNIGLRFDLQAGEIGTEGYFIECLKRASTLFEAAFSPKDEAYLVLLDYKYKRRKIRLSNFCFKQIEGLHKSQITYSKIKKLYGSSDQRDLWNQAIVSVTADRINMKNVLKAISHVDFPAKQPNFGFLSSMEIYFVNVDRKLIFNMYDDRGLDIIASDRAVIFPIYHAYKDWILDFDRESIEEKMGVSFEQKPIVKLEGF